LHSEVYGRVGTKTIYADRVKNRAQKRVEKDPAIVVGSNLSQLTGKGGN